MTTAYRIEKDSMGPVQVPADALYAAQRAEWKRSHPARPPGAN